MDRFPFVTPGVAAELGGYFFGSHSDFPLYRRLIQGGPVWDRQAIATTPVETSFFGTARNVSTSGNNKVAGKLGNYFLLIMGIGMKFFSEAAQIASLDLTEIFHGSFLKVKVDDQDWLDIIPLHYFLDGTHVSEFSNITPAATEHRADIGRAGDGAPFPVLIPYTPEASVDARIVWNTAGCAGVAAALVAEIALFGPKWQRSLAA